MPARNVYGNVLDPTWDFMGHQCNCDERCSRAKGLAAAVFTMEPRANTYKRPMDEHTLRIPGKISVHGRVINMYGQLRMGGPAKFASIPDTARHRKDYFITSLSAAIKHVQRRAEADGVDSYTLALPGGIGCGLAKGEWKMYKQYIDGTFDTLKGMQGVDKVDLVVVHLQPEGGK